VTEWHADPDDRFLRKRTRGAHTGRRGLTLGCGRLLSSHLERPVTAGLAGKSKRPKRPRLVPGAGLPVDRSNTKEATQGPESTAAQPCPGSAYPGSVLNMTDDQSTADPIADVFPADRIEARFVVAMAMARNDIELALRDGISAAQGNRQDFMYRVRLATAHLIEALDSLVAYTQESTDISKLMRRVAPAQQKELRKARGVVQKIGNTALGQIRNNTFHFPSPRTNYSPSSDDQLRDVLASMSDRACTLHLDHRGEDPVITLTFAGDVALALALAKHSADEETARQQFELTSAGAVSFTKWVDGLLFAYLQATGGYFGKPELIEDGETGAVGE
jgi:hypothetical protein